MGRGARKREKVVPFDGEQVVYSYGIISQTPTEQRLITRTEYKTMLDNYKNDDYALAVIKSQIKNGDLRVTND